MVLLGMRGRLSEMVWPMPGLRCVEHHGRGKGEQHQRRFKFQKRSQKHSPPCKPDRNHRRTSLPHALRGTQPRARRRPGARLHSAHRRRTGHRQKHPCATEPACGEEPTHTLCQRRGKRHPAETACRPHRTRIRQSVHCLRDITGEHLPAHRPGPAGNTGSGFHTDHSLRHSRILGRQRQPGTGMRSLIAEIRQRKRRTRAAHRAYQ